MSGPGADDEGVEALIQAFTGMQRLVALTRERRRRTASDAPTRLQRFALMAVAEAAPVAVSELAEELDVGSATLSQLLAALEGYGWITRSLDPADRRRHLVALTESGHAAVDGQRQRHRELLRAVLSQLTAEERAHLLGIVEKIVGLAATRPDLLRGEP